jgi:hypothetical protein
MIAGIGLVLDPQASDAAELHELLDGFLRDHEGLHEIDATTRRELKIIEFLKKKSEAGPDENGKFSGISAGAGGGSGSGMSQVQAQANASLLMGLSGQNFGIPVSNHRSTGPKPVLSALQQPVFQAITSTPSPRSPMDHGSTFSPNHGHHNRQLSRGALSTGSGGFTPPSEEAQSLLDNWCNSVINSSSYGPDGMVGMDNPSPWVSAPTPSQYMFVQQLGGGMGSGSASGMEGTSSNAMDVEGGSMPNGYETADWTYWETIVSAIGRDGGTTTN